MQTLDRLGLKNLVVESGAPTRRWCGSLGERLVELPLPSGLAISRESLDSLLLIEVGSAGAEVMIPEIAQIEQADSQMVVASIDVGEEIESSEYDFVIVAS